MSANLEKVTAFITANTSQGKALLLFEHPYAGIQIPAGTVEPGETPENGVLRESAEESGLAGLTIERYLGCKEQYVFSQKRGSCTVHHHRFSNPLDCAPLFYLGKLISIVNQERI